MDGSNSPEADQQPGPSEHGDAPEAQGVLDRNRMQALQSSLGDELREVIETYLDDAPRRIEEISAASRKADWEALLRNAHSLKSSSGIFGAQEMVDLCHRIELGAEGEQAASETDVQTLHAVFQKVQNMLNSYIGNSTFQGGSGNNGI